MTETSTHSGSATGSFAYEYTTIRVDRDLEPLYKDAYSNFGWVVEGYGPSLPNVTMETIKLKRDRRIKNRPMVLELQRQCESALTSIASLEKAKTTTAMAWSLGLGILGSALLAGAVFAINADLIVLSIPLGALGLVGWAAGYLAHNRVKASKTAQLTHEIALEQRALAIQGKVRRIFVQDRVDDDAIRHQALLDDARCYGRRGHSRVLAAFAGALLALGYLHKVPGRLYVEHLARVVTDHSRFISAALADGLFRRAGHDALHTRQIGGQLLAAWMRPALLSVLLLDLFERLALSFGFYFGGTYAGLQIQQLQLCVGQRIALRSVLLGALLAQPFFKNLYLHLGERKTALGCL